MTADQFPDMYELKVSTSLLSKTPDPPNSNGLRPIGQDSVTSIWCMVDLMYGSASYPWTHEATRGALGLKLWEEI